MDKPSETAADRCVTHHACACYEQALILAKAQRDRAITKAQQATGNYQWHPDQEGDYA